MLTDKNEVIGDVVTTKIGVKPIYISTGHMISLNTAVKIVQHVQRAESMNPTTSSYSSNQTKSQAYERKQSKYLNTQ